MKRFLTLMKREFLEWRTVFFVVIGLYVLLLLVLAYGSYRISNEMQRNSFTVTRDGEEVIIQFDGDSGDQIQFDDEEQEPLILSERPSEILEVWAHIVRGLMVGVNLVVVLLAIFYLADAVFKERSDSSTFYYRSLPTSDYCLLGAKLTFGTVGILFLSFSLSILLVLFVHLIIPSPATSILIANGLSLSQFQYGDLVADWLAFHLLQLLWLSPFALYFLLVSTVVKSRPLLTSIGVLIVAALAWKYLFQASGIPNQITVNLGVFGDILEQQWARTPDIVTPEIEMELFGNFWQYIFSLRTVIALAISTLFGWAVLAVYRKNIEVS